MVDVGPELLARMALLGFCAGVGGLYGLTAAFVTSKYRRRYKFEDDATRRDKARVWLDYARRIYIGDLKETAKYTLAWGLAGAFLFALGTIVVAGIGAVFL